MATGGAFDDAVGLARENPTLDIGVHLVLVGEPPFPATVAKLLRAVALGRVRIYDELDAQIRRILDAGLKPTHLDTHKHTHLLPPVLDAVAQLSEEYRIPWVRRPFDLPLTPAGPGVTWAKARHQQEAWASCATASRAYWPSTAAAPPITSRDSKSLAATGPPTSPD